MIQPWFTDAKLGIFIHWGIYAVNGIDESWAFFNGHISHADYMRQLDGFTASKWDPAAWASLFKRSGAKYAVLTAKHHDGVALWDTRQLTPSLVGEGLGHANAEIPLSLPARCTGGRDLMRDYADALRREGLKVGFYYSHLDWSHADYASIGSADPKANPFAHRESDPAAWERFLAFHRAQLRELCTGYGQLALLWFDGDWERDAETWRMAELRDQLHAWQPNVVLNSRMQGYGDYATPEQGLPVVPPDGPWEFCMTINNSWGYQPRDTATKSPQQVLRTFLDVIRMGGNLLLDVGPREDGTIPEEQVAVLEHLGAWISRHEVAVYGTRAGLPHGHFWGPSTQSKDGQSLYLFVTGDSAGEVCVRGLKSKVRSAVALGTGVELRHRVLGGADWMESPGVLWVELPDSAREPEITVVRLELETPIHLYRGRGQGLSEGN